MERENQSLLYNESYTRTFKRGPKRNKADNSKRNIFYALDGFVGLVGIILLAFAVLVIFKGGWAESKVHDVNTEALTAMIMLAIFSIFTSIIGGFGAFTNWKTLIVTYSILSLMCLSFHTYIVYMFMNTSKSAYIHMARSWWDTIEEETKIAIQDKHQCCGYLNIIDFAVPSTVCPPNLIKSFTEEEIGIRSPAQVKNKDSYYKEYKDQMEVKTSAGKVVPVNNDVTGGIGATGGQTGNTLDNNITGGGATGPGATAGGATAGAGDTGAGVGGDAAGGAIDEGGDEGGEDAGVDGLAMINNHQFDEGELRKRQEAVGDVEEAGAIGDDADAAVGGATGGPAGGAAGGATGGAGGIGGAPGGAAGGAPGGVAGGAAGGVAGGVAGGAGGATTGATTGAAGGATGGAGDAGAKPPLESTPPGCMNYIKPLVEGKHKTVYMGLAGLSIAYVLGSVMGFLYWKTLRGIKEFDEFA